MKARHLTDENLLLMKEDALEADQLCAAREHLADCATCRDRLDELNGFGDFMSETLSIPAAGRQAGHSGSTRFNPRTLRFLLAAAMLLGLAAATIAHLSPAPARPILSKSLGFEALPLKFTENDKALVYVNDFGYFRYDIETEESVKLAEPGEREVFWNADKGVYSVVSKEGSSSMGSDCLAALGRGIYRRLEAAGCSLQIGTHDLNSAFFDSSLTGFDSENLGIIEVSPAGERLSEASAGDDPAGFERTLYSAAGFFGHKGWPGDQHLTILLDARKRQYRVFRGEDVRHELRTLPNGAAVSLLRYISDVDKLRTPVHYLPDGRTEEIVIGEAPDARVFYTPSFAITEDGRYLCWIQSVGRRSFDVSGNFIGDSGYKQIRVALRDRSSGQTWGLTDFTNHRRDDARETNKYRFDREQRPGITFSSKGDVAFHWRREVYLMPHEALTPELAEKGNNDLAALYREYASTTPKKSSPLLDQSLARKDKQPETIHPYHAVPRRALGCDDEGFVVRWAEAEMHFTSAIGSTSWIDYNRSGIIVTDGDWNVLRRVEIEPYRAGFVSVSLPQDRLLIEQGLDGGPGMEVFRNQRPQKVLEIDGWGNIVERRVTPPDRGYFYMEIDRELPHDRQATSVSFWKNGRLLAKLDPARLKMERFVGISDLRASLNDSLSDGERVALPVTLYVKGKDSYPAQPPTDNIIEYESRRVPHWFVWNPAEATIEPLFDDDSDGGDLLGKGEICFTNEGTVFGLLKDYGADYMADYLGSDSRLIVIDLESKDWRVVSNGDPEIIGWHEPTGKLYFLDAGQDDQWDIYSVDARGENLKKLTDDAEVEEHPLIHWGANLLCWSYRDPQSAGGKSHYVEYDLLSGEILPLPVRSAFPELLAGGFESKYLDNRRRYYWRGWLVTPDGKQAVLPKHAFKDNPDPDGERRDLWFYDHRTGERYNLNKRAKQFLIGQGLYPADSEDSAEN